MVVLLKAISYISHQCDPVYGEAIAARLVVSLSVSLNLKVSFNSIVVIFALQKIPHESLTKRSQI
jgi:hypothetical protein